MTDNHFPYHSAKGILTQDLRRAVTHQILALLKVFETPHGFIVIAHLNWAIKQPWLGE